MKDLIIVGAGSAAREIYWHAKQSFGYGTEFEIKGFLDGDVKVSNEEYLKLPMKILGSVLDYKIEENDVFACAIGTPAVRKKLIDIMLEKGAEFIKLIHRTCIIQGAVDLGKGVVLCPFTFVNDHAKVGDYVMMNSMSGLGHDVELGSYSCLMGHVELCGYVKVGEAVYFGSGSKVLPHGKVGDKAYVGAGSIVLKKVKAGDKVFGNPAVSIL